MWMRLGCALLAGAIALGRVSVEAPLQAQAQAPLVVVVTIDGVIDEGIAARVGLSGAQIEEMYQIMAIANYEDRFVIPTVHRELGEDAYDLRGSCGFSFGNGCSDSRTETNLFGGPKKARTPMEVA